MSGIAVEHTEEDSPTPHARASPKTDFDSVGSVKTRGEPHRKNRHHDQDEGDARDALRETLLGAMDRLGQLDRAMVHHAIARALAKGSCFVWASALQGSESTHAPEHVYTRVSASRSALEPSAGLTVTGPAPRAGIAR